MTKPERLMVKRLVGGEAIPDNSASPQTAIHELGKGVKMAIHELGKGPEIAIHDTGRRDGLRHLGAKMAVFRPQTAFGSIPDRKTRPGRPIHDVINGLKIVIPDVSKSLLEPVPDTLVGRKNCRLAGGWS